MSELQGDWRYKATDDLEVTQVPDGYVIYDEAKEKVHYLNPTAAVIYSVCDGQRTVDDIRVFIQDAYDIAEAPDLGEFFASLEGAGLVCRIE